MEGHKVRVGNGLFFSRVFASRTNVDRPDLFCFFLLADFRGYYPGYSERINKLDHVGSAQGLYEEHRRDHNAFPLLPCTTPATSR